MSRLPLPNLLCALLMACGGDFMPRPGPSALPRPPVGALTDPFPECVDSAEVALWAAGCIRRCIPATHPTVVCHGNNEIHGLVQRADVKWMATLEPAAISGCGVPAYRVWSVRLDARPAWLMDRDTFSTWPSATTYCTAKPPGGFFETDFFAKHPQPAYLLNAADELIPTE